MRKLVVAVLGGLTLLLLAPGARAAATAPAAAAEIGTPLLPAPAVLRPQIEFWKAVFGKYSKYQVVIHDTEDLSRVYSVLDFRSLAESGLTDGEVARLAEKSIDAEKDRVESILKHLAEVGGQAESLSDSERRIANLFPAGTSPGVFRAAAADGRIRAQRGIRERFEKGVAVSRRYLPEIESIFRSEGVPVAITRMALVESCFNVDAYSKAGAAGVWQFMPATGRRFLRIDQVADERRDPVLSARAAAQFLRQNFERLGTWPLAITAYNHGPAGVARAVAELGTTDIAEIIERYKGPSFRFASRNFYPEFLAAVEVDAAPDDYFGPIEVGRPVPHEWVELPAYVPLRMVGRASGVSVDRLLELNPSLSDNVRNGKLFVPKGYAVRLPKGRARVFAEGYAALPRSQKFQHQRRLYVMHRVRRGQTLSHIARHYGTTVKAIQALNRMRGTMVRAGQALKIPRG